MPAGPIPNVTVSRPDRVDVALLGDRLRRDLLAAVAPDDVLEDVADVLGLVERGEHGVDRVRADLVAALDELDELVDDRAGLGDVLVVAVEREPVAAQRDRAVEPLAQRVEHAVADARELSGDLVRDIENLLHQAQCRGGIRQSWRRRARSQRARLYLADAFQRPSRAGRTPSDKREPAGSRSERRQPSRRPA